MNNEGVDAALKGGGVLAIDLEKRYLLTDSRTGITINASVIRRLSHELSHSALGYPDLKRGISFDPTGGEGDVHSPSVRLSDQIMRNIHGSKATLRSTYCGYPGCIDRL